MYWVWNIETDDGALVSGPQGQNLDWHMALLLSEMTMMIDDDNDDNNNDDDDNNNDNNNK